jgi:capsular polysaccharide biosynthesis protein
VTDRDETIIFSLNGDNGESERFGADDEFADTENRTADFVPGLVSLGFIKAAILRSARFCCVMAAVGLLLGVGVYVVSPRHYQASASLLLTHGPYEDSQLASVNNQAIAKTLAVAGLAVHELGLQQSPSNFLSTYIVTPVTDRVLTITASAPSANQAVLQANAVASAFLKFRADGMQTEQSLVVQSLNQQINAATQQLNSIGARISQLSSEVTSSTQQSKISSLRTEQTGAQNALANLQEALSSNLTSTLPAETAAVKSSEILSVTPLPHSRLKALLLYAALGLLAGLILGLGIVILRALMSDRLRQRDDIAYALNAPVKLSVGMLRARRWLPAWPGRTAKRDVDLRRVIAYLQSVVSRSTQSPASLVIVAVDNARVMAQAVAALATSYASQGQKVVAADLSRDAQMARLLGVKSAGVHQVSRDHANFTMAVPDRDDAMPIGPRRAVNSQAGPLKAADALVGSDTSADVLLILATLDPALGGDHLATWATNSVVVVSAGQSSAERLNGVGEMIRLAGTRLDSVVVLGADKSDESVGLTRRPDEQAGMVALGR